MLGGKVRVVLWAWLLGDEPGSCHRWKREGKEAETSVWHLRASSVTVPNEKKVDLTSA